MKNTLVFTVTSSCFLVTSACSNGLMAPARREPSAMQRAYAADAERPGDFTADQPPSDALPATPTLDDYLRYAALHNAGLKAAFGRWKAAVERVPQVEALPDPKLTYRYYISEIETRVGAMRQRVSLAQTFPWFGKLRLRGDAAAAAADGARQQFEAARLDLFYRVKAAYYDYYLLKRKIDILDENIRLLKHLERVARTRYTVGAASHPSVVRAQVELGKLADRAASLRDLRTPVAARLDAALNRSAGSVLPWPARLPDAPTELADQAVLARLKKNNPALKALDAHIAGGRSRLALAEREFYPDLTLGLDYVDINEPHAGRHPDDGGKDGVGVMASINLPIWWQKLRAGVREARNRLWAAEMARRQKGADLGAALKLALYRFRDAGRKRSLYRETLLPKARESLKSTEASFRAGKADFTDLVDAQRVLLAFDLSAEKAEAELRRSLAEIEKLAGGALPAGGTRKADDETAGDKDTDHE